MRRLLERGADIDLFCFAGETPLCRAVKYGRYAVVRFLLAQGADPNHNHLLGEFPDNVSTALADAAPDDYDDPNSRKAKTMARIHKALLEAGAGDVNRVAQGQTESRDSRRLSTIPPGLSGSANKLEIPKAEKPKHRGAIRLACMVNQVDQLPKSRAVPVFFTHGPSPQGRAVPLPTAARAPRIADMGILIIILGFYWYGWTVRPSRVLPCCGMPGDCTLLKQRTWPSLHQSQHGRSWQSRLGKRLSQEPSPRCPQARRESTAPTTPPGSLVYAYVANPWAGVRSTVCFGASGASGVANRWSALHLSLQEHDFVGRHIK